MGSHNYYFKSHFPTFGVNIQLKQIKPNFHIIFNFIEKPSHARTRNSPTNKFSDIRFLMFSCSIQSKIFIKQSFSFFNIQLVVKKSLRTNWTSSFLTGNFEKSAMLHSSVPLHHGKSVIFPHGKVSLHPICILI